ncbi:MAG: 1,4-alpha-glucan branching protein GlgB [Bacilli bacterium]|jgi:1,4-alpha-glucan branching enzyme|nr:1,4-alpha-glucan branching protein GlgB [Bacilli bacterium]MDD3388795.1 1,4-alpha-glucan branching protein GlgB [Bacilli bacterium]MDD4520479.1 1,4-alpha-glucan branching protein GlgB [Bacilli bacterium]MDY0399106.1 1,4-alpha-glucan branching protein GlgB [Bacilli bacterium]
MAYGLVYDYLIGQSIEAYKYFGAHFVREEVEEIEELPPLKKGGKPIINRIKKHKEYTVFRLYAPLAHDVSVIGEWNNWEAGVHNMFRIDEAGIWEAIIPGLVNYQSYKYHFRNAHGIYVDKADPFAFFSELRPNTCSRLFDIEGFMWHDAPYLKDRDRNFNRPMSIYEVHLGSWKGLVDGRHISYEEIADYLIPYVRENGFTHVEIMPITQYPFDGSWGYQATGFFSVDSRYGNPFQLMSFIDRMHQAGIGVILDFVVVHFASDVYGLIEFDGSRMYEYSDPQNTFSQWGSPQFDLGKDPVRSFLMSAVHYFIDYFHFDGIRIDAVSNSLFWDGNKTRGENTGGVEFLKRLTKKIHERHKDVMMIAEDSSDYSGVTKPLEYGGIGFDYKWDLGWMNDTLKYYAKDPVYKKYEHNKLTFSMHYFFSENFLLPLSHDEVVHGKGTIINKMWGDYDTKFALIRNLLSYQFAHPGKKLNFMGNELASFDEWNEQRSLPWVLKTFPKHDSITRLIRDLNRIYAYEPAMHFEEHNPHHFNWLMVDNAEQSVFAFERRVGPSHLVFVFNMTPNYYDNYQVGLSRPGQYQEIFNSDKDVYGGWNQYNGGALETNDWSGPENRPTSLTIKLASYGAMIFKYIGPKSSMGAIEEKEVDISSLAPKKKVGRPRKN